MLLIFLVRLLFVMTYQGGDESNAIRSLLKDERKGHKEKGLKGAKFQGAVNANYYQEEQSNPQAQREHK